MARAGDSRRQQSGEVPLRGVLAEFRTALREEIDAAKRHATSSAIPLTNGRRIAAVGGGTQYVFQLDNVLNLPGDAPGDLFVGGREPLEVNVVSVEGLSITLSVPEDIGAFVPSAKLQSDLTQLMRKLIDRIEAHADKPNPAGERVRGARSVSGDPVAYARAGSDELNPEQVAAVESCLGRDTTFIWGPPGTGKTRTIGAIGTALFDRSQSVLVVSHTNVAVDQALLSIAEKTDPAALESGLVLRAGTPRDRRLQESKDLLLTTHVERRSQQLMERRTELETEKADCPAVVCKPAGA